MSWPGTFTDQARNLPALVSGPPGAWESSAQISRNGPGQKSTLCGTLCGALCGPCASILEPSSHLGRFGGGLASPIWVRRLDIFRMHLATFCMIYLQTPASTRLLFYIHVASLFLHLLTRDGPRHQRFHSFVYTFGIMDASFSPRRPPPSILLSFANAFGSIIGA